jgi:AcrR family transcriptional regulator
MSSRSPHRSRGRRRDGRQAAERGQSIWDRPEPGARRAAYTREQIARTAIAIADADGFKAVSMRRVAGELRAGTMTLYHYVRNKDDLMSLIDDAIMGELLIPEGEMPDNWRDALATLARRSRDALLRHPWTVEIPPLTEGGPNGTKHFEQTLVAVAGSGLDWLEQVEVAALVDDYVFGFAMRRNQFVATSGGDPAALADQWADHARKRLAALDLDAYPNVAALFGERDPAAVFAELIDRALGPERFERGLELLLDGIERRVERARAGT